MRKKNFVVITGFKIIINDWISLFQNRMLVECQKKKYFRYHFWSYNNALIMQQCVYCMDKNAMIFFTTAFNRSILKDQY